MKVEERFAELTADLVECEENSVFYDLEGYCLTWQARGQ